MVCRACPDRYYQPGSNNRWIYLGNYSRVRDESLSSVISAENTLRGAAQRAEALEKGLRVLQKVQDTPEDEQKLQRYTEELKEIPKTYCARQQDLHEQVSLLPRDLREAWYAVQKVPTWYLRDELVKDCIGRDGCCSRACQCCHHR
ncbi:hypothetical protein N7492_003098 [Penicillium capsulatum]|uniref:Uncharacterized protein n=1 Tax=Penicillium capsulatum TaxID=69766 RepID=A0A9W9LVV3_9EURO|nr:hypothetical protein N7492_003098 [Penicillium capsulatum]